MTKFRSWQAQIAVYFFKYILRDGGSGTSLDTEKARPVLLARARGKDLTKDFLLLHQAGFFSNALKICLPEGKFFFSFSFSLKEKFFSSTI